MTGVSSLPYIIPTLIGKRDIFCYAGAMMHTGISPLITIGITCFNAEDTIARAIQSAIAQDWPNFEIIVVDDSSTDNSVAVIRKIMKTDRRIRLYRHEKNGGLPVALNTIIKHARGEYIGFFDDDDSSHPTRISKQYKRLREFEKSHPGKPVVCYCNRRVIKNDGGKIDAEGTSIGRKPKEPYGTMMAEGFFWGKFHKDYVFGGTGTSTTFASKRLFREFGYDPEIRRAEDWDLAIRVGMSGGYCIGVDEPLVDWHETTTSDKSAKAALDTNLAMAQKYREFLVSSGRFNYRGYVYLNYAKFHKLDNIFKTVLYIALVLFFSPKAFKFITLRLIEKLRGKTVYERPWNDRG